MILWVLKDAINSPFKISHRAENLQIYSYDVHWHAQHLCEGFAEPLLAMRSLADSLRSNSD